MNRPARRLNAGCNFHEECELAHSSLMVVEGILRKVGSPSAGREVGRFRRQRRGLPSSSDNMLERNDKVTPALHVCNDPMALTGVVAVQTGADITVWRWCSCPPSQAKDEAMADACALGRLDDACRNNLRATHLGLQQSISSVCYDVRNGTVRLSSRPAVGVTKRDSKSVAYENRTKSVKCGGLETNGPTERISGLGGCVVVRRF